MFIIASSGRSGTLALCNALANFSDYEVQHEPPPRLLKEAYLKHHNLDYRTPIFEERMAFFRQKASQKYGESFRAQNLLDEILEAAPNTRFLLIFRNPLEYIVSAHSKKVFRKNDEFDQNRIVPLEIEEELDQLTIAEKIAQHWICMNQYLVNFAVEYPENSKVIILDDLSKQIKPIAKYLGVSLKRPFRLRRFLGTRPNAATSYDSPPGYDEPYLLSLTENLWSEINKLAEK